MMSIKDTENLITTMRAQARALDAGATALENAIAPMKLALANVDAVYQASDAAWRCWFPQHGTKD